MLILSPAGCTAEVHMKISIADINSSHVWCLFIDWQVKSVFNITAKEGRKRSISALVAVGNGNGAAGESKHTRTLLMMVL